MEDRIGLQITRGHICMEPIDESLNPRWVNGEEVTLRSHQGVEWSQPTFILLIEISPVPNHILYFGIEAVGRATLDQLS
jgi:hypothetical protein